LADEGGEELPLDENFVEQAEYISEGKLLEISADHPDEDSIVRRLSVGGAKLLVGPRGCGKTTLMRKSYFRLLRSDIATTLPVYVNFKLSLKLEPLYANTPNAAFWFKMWLNLKIYEGLHQSVEESGKYVLPTNFPTRTEITSYLYSIESGRLIAEAEPERFTVNGLSASVRDVLGLNGLVRCVLLLDDAAHAFSPSQQEDFFEFFRQVKSREISPKAAIYPGIMTHSPTFHVGHDAEQIDVWIKPDRSEYGDFMRTMATKRFGGALPDALSREALEFLSFASFGVPRSFLNMMRTIYHDASISKTVSGSIDRRKLLEIARQARELSHSVYDSLSYKLPTYKIFVETGGFIYQRILGTLKEINRKRTVDKQALEVGIRRPIAPEIEKVIGFLQYAGLLMPVGDNSRGDKGVFEIYMVHFGDLITENAIIGRRTKRVAAFVAAFKAQTHQAWPRIAPETLADPHRFQTLFRLSLPHCQRCGAERASERARFCQSCGEQLKTPSLYDDLVNQDIDVLQLSDTMVGRIKKNSKIRKVKDILIDTNRVNLRSIPLIGPVRASRIANLAEEHVA
jgi:hypothetical protein